MLDRRKILPMPERPRVALGAASRASPHCVSRNDCRSPTRMLRTSGDGPSACCFNAAMSSLPRDALPESYFDYAQTSRVAFDDKGAEVQANGDAEVTKLHAKMDQLVERDFLAKAFDR
jgi:hypothetical protein